MSTDRKEYMRRYCAENAQRLKEYRREYHARNKARIIARVQAWEKANPERVREIKNRWVEENREKVRASNCAYSRKNPEKIRAKGLRYQRYLRATSPVFVIKNRLRCRLAALLRKRKARKITSALNLVGCSTELLIQHLESQFLPGMSWENRRQWHIDHIVPCAAFDLTDLEQQKKCFHYTNLQPLWAADNIRKGGVRRAA